MSPCPGPRALDSACARAALEQTRDFRSVSLRLGRADVKALMKIVLKWKFLLYLVVLTLLQLRSATDLKSVFFIGNDWTVLFQRSLGLKVPITINSAQMGLQLWSIEIL